MKIANIKYDQHRFIVSGDLAVNNVMMVFNQSLPEITKQAKLDFDFSGVTSSDSSGLALIIEWIKFAKSHNKAIHFSHLSNDLLSIAKAGRIEQMILE